MVKRQKQKQKQKQSQIVNITLGDIKPKRKYNRRPTGPRLPPVSRGFPPFPQLFPAGFPQPPPPPTLQPPPAPVVRATASVLVPEITRVRERATPSLVQSAGASLLSAGRSAGASLLSTGASILSSGLSSGLSSTFFDRAFPGLVGENVFDYATPEEVFEDAQGPDIFGLLPIADEDETPLNEPDRLVVPPPPRPPRRQLAYPDGDTAPVIGIDPLVPVPLVVSERRGQLALPPAPGTRIVPTPAPRQAPEPASVIVVEARPFGQEIGGRPLPPVGSEDLPVAPTEPISTPSKLPSSERVDSGLRADGRPDGRTKMGKALNESAKVANQGPGRIPPAPETVFTAVPPKNPFLAELTTGVAKSQARRKAKQEKEAQEAQDLILPPGFAGIQGDPPPEPKGGGLEKP